jgi:hypothetical protein
LQAALLFDQRAPDLEAIMRDFSRIEAMRSGTSFNVPEASPGSFYRLFAADEQLMLTFEALDRPANPQAFQGALASPYTGLLTPDIRTRLTRAHSHILIEVSHGVLAGVDEDPQFAAMLSAVGHAREGASQQQFERRLAVLGLMARVAAEHAMPVAVHWTQSDLLVAGDIADKLAAMEVPGPLHIHPILFGPRPAAGEPAKVGIRTFGARHWLGREVIIQPSELPWAANFETILAFLRIATMANGYVIPHDDTFGPEDRSQSYRVLHHDAGAVVGDGMPSDMPLYELVPLKHTAYDFVTPEHVPDDNVIDDRAFPAALMPADQETRMALANEWGEKRKLAEGVGGRFEVRAVGEAVEAPPPPPAPPPVAVSAPTTSHPGLPSLSGRGLRSKVFGRKEA